MGRVVAGLSAAVIVATLCACSTDSPTAPQSTFPEHKLRLEVTGRVIDYRTNEGVSGATLDWITFGTLALQRATAGARGVYAVSLAWAPSYLVGVSGITTNVVVVPELQYRTDFYVNAGSCVLFYGYLFDAVTKRPVSGARVSWIGHSVTSGADGGFRMDAGCGRTYGTGTTLMNVSHPGYNLISQFSTRAEFLQNGGIYRRDFELTPQNESAQILKAGAFENPARRPG